MPPHRVYAEARTRNRLDLSSPVRSLILAPGDDEARLTAALNSGADAVVIDLAVAMEAREAARAAAARALGQARQREGGPVLMARVNLLGDGETDLDLDAVIPGAPVAIVLPGALGAPSIQQLSVKLAVREARLDLEDGATRIVAVADTADGVLRLPSCARASARLAGIAWDAEALRREVGAEVCRDPSGGYAGPLRMARNMILLAAAASGVAAIDTVFAPLPSARGLRVEARAARRDGFAAKFALDAAQADVINAAFASKPTFSR